MGGEKGMKEITSSGGGRFYNLSDTQKGKYITKRSAIYTGLFLIVVTGLWYWAMEYFSLAYRIFALAAVVGWIAIAIFIYYREIPTREEFKDKAKKFKLPFYWLFWLGAASAFIGLPLLIIVFTAYVYRSNPVLLGLSIVGLNAVPCFLMGRIAWYQRSKDLLPWLTIGFSLGLAPVLLAWGIATWAWSYMKPEPNFEFLAGTSYHSPEIQGPRERPLAVALSGGGYRAAVIHAGLLSSMKAHNIKPDILTTVSGGSIIGAAYAVGIAPEEFATALEHDKPGLENDIWRIHSVVLPVLGSFVSFIGLDWQWPNFTTTFRDHLNRYYFHGKTLAVLHDHPVFIANVTDIDPARLNAREVLYKARAARTKLGETSLDQRTSVADVVAASGAFPGPFPPMKIKWAPHDPPKDLNSPLVITRKFSDGGIVENLGVDGLQRYIAFESTETKAFVWPRVLIISDASDYEADLTNRENTDLLSQFSGVARISFFRVHVQLYATYTGNKNFFEWVGSTEASPQVSRRQYSDIFDFPKAPPGQDSFHTVAIPSTSSAIEAVLKKHPSCKYENSIDAIVVQETVRKLSSLKELSPEQVKKTFWLGYAMGEIYWPDINCALKGLDGETCRSNMEEGKSEVQCPTLRDVQSRLEKER
jgi:predicted acylesterase/phospholipase RssA